MGQLQIEKKLFEEKGSKTVKVMHRAEDKQYAFAVLVWKSTTC